MSSIPPEVPKTPVEPDDSFAETSAKLPYRRPRVGREIRRWRGERGLTLSQVAERSGLNLGYLSQIENEKASPSLDALAAIAASLEVPIAWLLLEQSPAPRVVRATERKSGEIPGTAGTRAQEADGGARDLRILEVSVAPGHRTGLHAHVGDEHHLVLAGRFRMTQGEHELVIGPGDYLTWDATLPHDVESLGPDEGRILVLYARRGARTPA